MSASSTFRGLFAVASAIMVSLSSAVAGWVGIDDKGEFFSGNGETTALRRISGLQRELNKDVAIETFKAIPAEVGSAPGVADKAALNRFMEQWAVKQARARPSALSRSPTSRSMWACWGRSRAGQVG